MTDKGLCGRSMIAIESIAARKLDYTALVDQFAIQKAGGAKNYIDFGEMHCNFLILNVGCM